MKNKVFIDAGHLSVQIFSLPNGFFIIIFLFTHSIITQYNYIMILSAWRLVQHLIWHQEFQRRIIYLLSQFTVTAVVGHYVGARSIDHAT